MENLFERGHRTIDSGFNVLQTKKIGSHFLHSANLLFFVEQMYESGLIPANVMNENSRELYDLMLTQGFGFIEEEDIHSSQQLFRAAKE